MPTEALKTSIQAQRRCCLSTNARGQRRPFLRTQDWILRLTGDVPCLALQEMAAPRLQTYASAGSTPLTVSPVSIVPPVTQVWAAT